MAASTPVLDAAVAAPEGDDAGPDRPWWGRLELWVGLLVVAACCVFVFVQLDPKLLLRDTTPAGGDTGAHVWWPAYLRDHLLPWRLAGWSPDFYAGFPAGQFYFPVPALLIVALNAVAPYNVAFKLVTALGPVLLPLGAFVLGRGLRAREPAPAGMAVGATAFLFFTGDPGTSPFDHNTVQFDQHIMGGNLASNLAGEFSYTLALALALLFLGTLAWSLRTRRGLWLPAALLALTAMSHLVVAVFAVVGAVLVVLATRTRPRVSRRAVAAMGAAVLVALLATFLVTTHPSGVVWAVLVVVALAVVLVGCWPRETLARALAIGVVGALLTAVWSVPLAATLRYTTDMRYGAITQYGDFLFPFSYLWGVRGAWPWQWGATVLLSLALVPLLGGLVARVAGWGDRARVDALLDARRATFVLVALTALSGVLFRVWSSVQVAPAWNLRVLPFWYLGVYLLMGVGVAELVRGGAWLAGWAREWVEVPEPAPGDGADDARVPPAARTGRWTPALVATVTAAVLTVAVAVGALVNVDRSKDFLPFWVKWNESGYQDQSGKGSGLAKAYGEYRTLVDRVGKLPPGRVIVEGGQGLDRYGTPLSLMLLPYWTDGRFPSTEGVYYESSATTPYVFMALATLDGPGNASNPVRGVPYKTFDSFSSGVRYLQALGVNYFVAHSKASRHAAGADPRLRLVATSPTTKKGIAPDTWSVYEVHHAPLVTPLAEQPVVADPLSVAEQARCRRRLIGDGVAPSEVHLHDWQDCIAVPWFDDPTGLDRPLVARGPAGWQHAQPSAARALPVRALPPVTVSRVRQTRTGVSFHVSRPGVPVLVKVSYFPNWQVSGAAGVYRSTPNFMVVVPTSHDVRLRYSTTTAEWLGRLLTLVGLAGLAALVVWGRRSRSRRPVG
jgi:hypothetical protein